MKEKKKASGTPFIFKIDWGWIEKESTNPRFLVVYIFQFCISFIGKIGKKIKKRKEGVVKFQNLIYPDGFLFLGHFNFNNPRIVMGENPSVVYGLDIILFGGLVD